MSKKKIKQHNLFDDGVGTDIFDNAPRKSAARRKTADGLLALDIATKTGFCCATASGTWDFTPKRDESKGMRLIRFKAKLREICETEQIKMIIVERVSGFHKNAIIVASELHGVMKLFCEENEIEYKAYSSSEIKKFATNNGNAGKEKMIEAAFTRYGVRAEDDNEADALHIYHLAIEDLQL